MQRIYPAKYCDAHGEIATSISNDGVTLWMSLEGVVFSGGDFDSLSPNSPTSSRFCLASGSLCACTLAFDMPVTLLFGIREVQAVLEVQLRLGNPTDNGGLDGETLLLVLVFQETRIISTGQSGWFEDEMADLQRRLPDDGYFKTCFGCGLSDYSPVGHGLFGGLACFRNNKAGYHAMKSKRDLFDLWETHSGWVQETDLCPEFERREPSTGYRG